MRTNLLTWEEKNPLHAVIIPLNQECLYFTSFSLLPKLQEQIEANICCLFKWPDKIYSWTTHIWRCNFL